MAEIDTQVTTASVPAATTAGAKLRAAREAAGLSIDAVAHQLKLAPRQVTALEEDDWQRLPGRTFVRGFARNYARFVQLDPDAVLALLPASDAAPALSRPTLAASPRPIGEIPAERIAKPSAARWVVPLLLVAVVAVVAYYEVARPTLRLPPLLASLVGEHNAVAPTTTTSAPPTGAASAPSPATAPKSADAMPASPAATGTPATSNSNAAGSGVTVLPTPSTDTAAANEAPAATTPSANVNAPTAAAPAGEAALVLTFKGTSWAEVKDAKGRVVLQMTGGAGMTQTVSAAAPLELALGNAPEVGVTFRGQALDLSAYTRGNVARVSLQ